MVGVGQLLLGAALSHAFQNWGGNGQFGRWSGGALRELPLTPCLLLINKIG